VSLHADLEIIIPVHLNPQVREVVYGELGDVDRVVLLEPLEYPDMIEVMRRSVLVLTDSGGIQEETTVLGIPCLTLRENTERPVTVSLGTNRIVGTDAEKIVREAMAALDEDSRPTHSIPALWDGHTADRILDALGQS